MNAIILYSLLTTALYYLLSRATITKFIWTRYPSWLDTFMLCAYCSGFWYGFGTAALLGTQFHMDFLGLPRENPITWTVVGLCSIVWTPILSTIHLNERTHLNG